MLRATLLPLAVALAVSSARADPPVPTKPVVPDTRCAQPPAIEARGFRHKRSKLIAKTGSHNHRGIDLIASEDDPQQVIAGKQIGRAHV